jgi:hypothetical protein
MSEHKRDLTSGMALALLTVALAGVALRVASVSSDTLRWPALAAGLLALETIVLTFVAVMSVPFEPRLRRWSQPHDPLAIGYQLDLATTELNAPVRQTMDSRWLWAALPPLLVTFALGGWLLATTAAPDDRPGIILEDAAIRTAEHVVAQSPPAGAQVVAQHVELTTYALARDFIGERGRVLAAPADTDRLVYDIWFGPSPSSINPKDDPFAGPHVVVDAESGAVLLTSGLP